MPPRRPVRGYLPADPGPGDLFIEFGDQRVEVGGVLVVVGGLVAGLLGLGAEHDPPLLVVGGRVRGQVGFVLEVPAFPALRGPQGPGPFGAGRADVAEGVPARDEHLLGLAGVQVGAAELDRADARAVLDG